MSEPTSSTARQRNPFLGRLPAGAPAILALLSAAIIFGTAAVPAKTALKHIPPFVLAELRWVIALLLLGGLLKRSGERPIMTRFSWILGLTGLALFYLFYSYGLRATTAANATLIAGATPVIVALMAAGFLGERITRLKTLGIAVSLVGVSFIVIGGGAALGGSMRGNLLIIGSNVSWAIYTVLGRRVLTTGSNLANLVGIAVAGLILMAPLALWELRTADMSQVEPRDWLFVVYLAIGPSALAYLLWGYGLGHMEASRASVFGNIMPLAGALAGWLLLDEHLGLPHVAGGACIIAGVWIATRATAKPVASSQPNEASP